MICPAARSAGWLLPVCLPWSRRCSSWTNPQQDWIPGARDEILGLISDLHEKRHITCVLVSHSMEDVARYVERIIVMNRGEVMYDGTPKEVFSHYRELEEIGLAAPQVTYVMNRLKEKGLDVRTDATTVEEARDEILRALAAGGRV